MEKVRSQFWCAPEMLNDKKTICFGMDGYRDNLCDLVSQIVECVKIAEDETIIFDFEKKSQLWIWLRSRKAPGERAIFTAPPHILYTW